MDNTLANPYSPAEAEPNPQEVNMLVALFNQKRYAEMEACAREITERFPNHGIGWKALGTALLQQGRNEEALVPLQKAADLSPKDAQPHNSLGKTLFKLNRLSEAGASYQRALELKPDYTEAHYNLGDALNGQNRLSESEASYRRALELKPDFVEAYNKLGGTLLKLGRLPEAQAVYRRVLELKPDYAEIHLVLGNILYEQGNIYEAETCYRRALEFNPNYAVARQKLGDTLRELGRLDEALANYRLALEAKGDWKEALHRLTTPLVVHTGLVLGSHYPATSFAEASKQTTTLKEQVGCPTTPVVPLTAGQELRLPEVEPSEPKDVKKLRIMLIYPPPWQIPSPGDPVQGMPFGPPREKSDHNLILDGDFQTITYGLLTIAAQAKRAGYEVSVYNLAACAWRDVVTLIAESEADVYGISAFTSNRRGMGAVAALIRQLHPQAHITVGGPFVTALPQDTLRYFRDIDTAVIGEGEETFMELLECLGSGRPAAGIPGSAWRNGEEIAVGPMRPRIKDLNALASLFDYFTNDIVMTSRGCPSKCTFCGSVITWGRMLRFHSAESCLDIYKKALARLPIPFMMIKDDTFTAHRRRTLAICDAIIESKMNFLWSCDTRVDNLDDELLRKMRLAGCQMISLGVESGSPEILKNIRKETTPEMVLEATRSAQKYGMHVRYYMIFCNRGETAETVKQSNDLIKAGRPNRYSFGALSFFPGTEDWAILREQQGLTPDIFFTNDFKELTIATGRRKELQDAALYVICDIGAIEGFDYTVEEREAVVDRLPHLHSVHVELANAYFRAGRIDEAMSALKRAEELNFPINGILYNLRACIALARGDVGGTFTLLEHALQCYPHHAVMNNLKILRAWADIPMGDRGRPPLLNDSVLAMAFGSQLGSNGARPTAM